MQLSDTLYAIHGTLDVDSIEANESEGCIRMLKEDVEELFDLVPMGTVVKIREGFCPRACGRRKIVSSSSLPRGRPTRARCITGWIKAGRSLSEQ